MIVCDLGPRINARRVIHVDRPCHLNVGDMLIDMGIREAIKICGAFLFDSYALHDLPRLLRRSLPKDVVILLHGGGNFGDLYFAHDKLRQNVIAAFPHNEIIILPQSIYYNNPENSAGIIDAISKHENIICYARDSASKNFLLQHVSSKKVGMLPDMAMMLAGRWNETPRATDETLLFRRKDIESTGINNGFDWRDIVSRLDRKMLSFLKKILFLQAMTGLSLGGHLGLTLFQSRMTYKAINLYKNYGCIDTDRLHGLILGQLLGAKVSLKCDNSYGKIRRYLNTWFPVVKYEKSN
jgi:pyruvyl transferase EpsO